MKRTISKISNDLDSLATETAPFYRWERAALRLDTGTGSAEALCWDRPGRERPHGVVEWAVPTNVNGADLARWLGAWETCNLLAEYCDAEECPDPRDGGDDRDELDAEISAQIEGLDRVAIWSVDDWLGENPSNWPELWDPGETFEAAETRAHAYDGDGLGIIIGDFQNFLVEHAEGLTPVEYDEIPDCQLSALGLETTAKRDAADTRVFQVRVTRGGVGYVYPYNSAADMRIANSDEAWGSGDYAEWLRLHSSPIWRVCHGGNLRGAGVYSDGHESRAAAARDAAECERVVGGAPIVEKYWRGEDDPDIHCAFLAQDLGFFGEYVDAAELRTDARKYGRFTGQTRRAIFAVLGDAR